MWQFIAITFLLFWLVTLARHLDRHTLLRVTQRAVHTYLLAMGLLLGVVLAAGAYSAQYSYVYGRKVVASSTTYDAFVFKDERVVAVILMGWFCWYAGLVRSYYSLRLRHAGRGRVQGWERDARAVLVWAVVALALALCYPEFRALAGAGLRRLRVADMVDRSGVWLVGAARRTALAAEVWWWQPRTRWDMLVAGVRRQWRWLKFMALR